MLLKHQWVNEEIKEEIRKYLETNENGNITLQNLCGVAKTVLWGKFIATQPFLKKQEKSQINNLTYYLKEVEKRKAKPKISRRKEIHRDKWQWKHKHPKPIGSSKSSSKREVYSNTILRQETRNISNKQPKLAPKTIRERRTKKPQSQQKERNYKDQVRNKWKRNEGNNSKNQWN